MSCESSLIVSGFGVVESINTTIKAVPRRARGMRDEAVLVQMGDHTTDPIRA
jgi:hypothetical protein